MSDNEKDESQNKDEIYTAEIGSRLEWVQALRRKAIEEIDKDKNWFDDEGRSIAMTGMLKDYEKQELVKAKMKQDQENAEDDRAIAQQAIDIIADIRRQTRESGDPFKTDVTAPIPTADNSKLPEQGDQVALSQKEYTERKWSDFELEMIKAGHDPLRRYDEETGQIVNIRQNDSE